MIVELITLGLLQRKNMHGYEIKKQIEFEMQNIDIKFGSIYHAFNKLQKQGLITKTDIEPAKPGKPARKGYAITKKGEAVFLNHLKEAISNLAYPIDASLHFIYALQREELISLLRKRYRLLKQKLNQLASARISRTRKISLAAELHTSALETDKTELVSKAKSMIPFLIKHGVKHQKVLLKTELNWLADFIKEIKSLS